MENLVITEFVKEKEILGNELRNKYNLSENDIDDIYNKISVSLNKMIQLVKDGKSAHEKFFSDIILNSVDAIIGFDNEYKIFLWNKGAERIFGYSKKEVMNCDFSILIPDYLLKRGEKEYLINEVKQKGFLENHESERITKDGKIVNVNISRFSVYNEENEPIGSVGIIRDFTFLKKLEKELREKENLALIGEVVSSIAHKLSNPLNIIAGNADFLLLNKNENDVEYEGLKTMLEEATKITKSIRHLLNFSRPIKVNKSKNDINDLINKVLADSKYIYSHSEKKITFKKNLQQDLGEFEFDKSEIEEVISNLVTNSIQAIASEGVITVTTSKKNDNVKIEISDTGNGISPENLENVFLPFFSSKEYGKGTGLGLSLAKRIVKEHKGEITIKSNIGKGTAIKILLPA